jgi:phage terminase large subunit-like protein
MGQAIVFAWVDEQSPDEVSLIGQCTTRTATTGGCVAVTATPELGVTDFYAQCKDDKTGKIYFQNATWYDCPHFTPEIIEEMLARTPYFQRKMRSLGIPVMGVGAIYPYSDEEITCAPFPIPDHWHVLAALDFGYSGISDPSIILFIAYNPETDTRYVFGEWSSEMERDAYANSHLPDYMARKLTGDAPDDWTLNSGKPEGEFDALGFPGIVVKSPHDGNGIQPGTQQTRAEIMRKIGANVHPQLFEIPPDLLPLENNKRSLTGSIALCAQWFKDGKLKIFTSCIETMRELRLYQWQQKGSRSIPADKDNHFMDAMRIGAIRVSYDGDYMSAARSRVPVEINDDNSYIDDMGAFDL